MIGSIEEYLSPRHLAEALGVSQSSVKRWSDNGLITISRTAGGHRRIALGDAIRFIREHNMPVVNPSLLGLPSNSSPDTALTPMIRDHLLAGAVPELTETLQQYYMHGGSIAALGDGPIREAFAHIGELWEHNTTGIMIEHRAVDCCLQALTTLRNLVPRHQENASCALGGAPPGDPYILPALLAAMTLEEAGWRTINLGPNTPWETMATAVEQLRPRLLWITVSAPLTAEQAAEGRALVQQLGHTDIAVSVGGRQVESLGLAATADSLQDLADFARRQQLQLEQSP